MSRGTLARYRSRKTVFVLKIEKVEPKYRSEGAATLTPEGGMGPIDVDRKFVEKYNPQAGGYYVQDGAGEESFFTAEALEAEYEPVDNSNA